MGLLLGANCVIRPEICAAVCNYTLKVLLHCFNLGWVSLSIVDIFCVKHAQSILLTYLSLAFRWNFGRPDFRQAREEGIDLRNDAVAGSTHSKSSPLSDSCGWGFDSTQEVLQAAFSKLNM